jgi:four helix bundle suffix protein
METRPPETPANIAICLIHQANYLLDRQLQRLERDFVQKGGIRPSNRSHRDYKTYSSNPCPK